MIATFEDEPYLGAFSGNVIELCPVGALTSTQYRFEARPWEIQNVPTVCGLCPVGCNISATTREGKVKRVMSRNHPEVDEGWLCDKGRFAYAHLDASDRITAPVRKAGPRRFEALSWDDALVTDDRTNVGRVEAAHVYFLPLTPNGRGVADAWSAAGDEEPGDEEPRVVVICGDEAAMNEDVRAMAAEAGVVIGIGMFENSFRSVADLVLPGTSYLERDGTTINVEGRLQRQRRAVLAPVPDTLAWISKLAARFG